MAQMKQPHIWEHHKRKPRNGIHIKKEPVFSKKESTRI